MRWTAGGRRRTADGGRRAADRRGKTKNDQAAEEVVWVLRKSGPTFVTAVAKSPKSSLQVWAVESSNVMNMTLKSETTDSSCRSSIGSSFSCRRRRAAPA